jgi:hypothetical protein
VEYAVLLFFPLLFLLGWSMHVGSAGFLLGGRSRYRRLGSGC